MIPIIVYRLDIPLVSNGDKMSVSMSTHQLHMGTELGHGVKTWLSSWAKIAGFLAFISGIFIYLIFRVPSASLSNTLQHIGLWESYCRFRADDTHLPSWILQILPDALWMFSLSTLILWIWGFERRIESLTWLGIILVAGCGMEFLQYTGTLPGQFDVWDLGSMILAVLVPLCFTFKSNVK